MFTSLLATATALLASTATVAALPAVPGNCNSFYRVEAGDTCSSIVSFYNSTFNAIDLYTWNPSIGRSCFGLYAYTTICVGTPGYNSTGPIVGGALYNASQTPVPLQPGIVSTCQQFEYTDARGTPGFGRLLSENAITAQQWYDWNYPGVNETQPRSVWADYFSCVKA